MFGRCVGVSFVALIACCAGAAPALAAQRFAEPGGDGPPATCPQSNPCSLQSAIEDISVIDGDEVILLPGNYVETDMVLGSDAINIHGAAAQPRPQIISSAGTALLMFDTVTPGSRVADLDIEHSGSSIGLNMSADGSVERVEVHSSGGSACQPTPFAGGVTIRDSVCWNSAGGIGVRSSVGSGLDFTAVLRNVSAVATGPGSMGVLVGGQSGGKARIDGRNVIASGDAVDIHAATDSMSSPIASLLLTSSNFDTSTTNGGAGTTVSAPGSAGSQTTPPVFVDAAAGNFHQASGSPTIDAGIDDGGLGPTDFEGDPRVLGGGVDIGADEFVPDTDPPETAITKGPKNKTKKRKAKFEFAADEPGSTFECKLDKGDFEPCTSPHTVKVRKGKHTFAVQAIDQAGNVGAPATDRWKRKKKK